MVTERFRFSSQGVVGCIMIVTLHFEICFSNTVFLAPGSCACLGDQLVYECTYSGGVATVWHGSAFSNCSSDSSGRNEIRFRHGRFNSQATASCNDGRIIAQTGGIVNNTKSYFTSQLKVNVTADMDNKTIQCDRDRDGITANREEIGMDTVMIATRFVEFAMVSNVHLAEVKRNQLIFEWLIDVPINCNASYKYIITSSGNCGSCPNSTMNMNASCEVDIDTLSKRNELCTFLVMAQACGEGNVTENTTVVLSVPNSPKLALSSKYYDKSGILIIVIVVNKTESQSFNFSENITGAPTSYTIVYFDSVTRVTCFRETIPASLCESDGCNHVFNTSESECNNCDTTNINVTAFATNLLGDGQVSTPITIDAIENGTVQRCNNLSSDGSISPGVVFIIVALLIILLALLAATVILVKKKKTITAFAKRSGKNLSKSTTDALTANDQQNVSAEMTSGSSPVQGCLYARLRQTTGGHSTKHNTHISLSDNGAEYAKLQCSASETVGIGTGVNESILSAAARGSEDVTTLKPAADKNNMLSSVSTKEHAPIWENCIVYADLKHSSSTKKSSAALTAIQKFTTDDRILYSEVKHSAVNTTGPSSAESAHALNSMPQQPIDKRIDDKINLDMLLIQLRPQAASKWYSLGLALGEEKETMDKYSDHPDEACLVEVLDSWLRNHKGKPTWKEIAKALEEIGFHELATQLLHSYETGHLPIEVDMDTVPDID